jgi:hypothetical protein
MKFHKNSSINAQWHKKHPMPANPTLEERIKWHTSHTRHCACRPIPASLLAVMKNSSSKIKAPDHTH